MIKINLKTLAATRENIPQFLVGLSPESLIDLSWTDPSLGVSDSAWWPETDASPVLAEFQRYGAESFVVDADRQIVTVTRAVEAFSDDEIAAILKSRVPTVVTMRQARLALLQAGHLTTVNAAIKAMTGDAGEAARIEWEYSQAVEREKALTQAMKGILGLTSNEMDELFVAAAAL